MNLTLKRHHNLIVLLFVLAAALIVALGSQPIVGYSARSIERVVAQSLG